MVAGGRRWWQVVAGGGMWSQMVVASGGMVSCMYICVCMHLRVVCSVYVQSSANDHQTRTTELATKGNTRNRYQTASKGSKHEK